MFKLVKLSANKDTFHNVTFKDGLNVVMGKPQNKGNLDVKSTTNGIGKSLLIKIIDFCLGSDKIKEWEEPLKDWIFTLEVNIDNRTHLISRAVNNQRHVTFNGEVITLSKFRDKIKELLSLSPDFSFRQIINRFLRKGKVAYNNYLTTIPKEKDSNTLLVISYLLGLKYSLCQQKINLKKELDSNNEFLSRSQKDPSFRELFGIGKYDIDLELSNIEFDINRLEDDIANKNYAENYTEIQEKANLISESLDELNNRKFILENRIEIINEALNRKISVDLEDVQKIYNGVNIYFKENLKHSLEEIEAFHKTLLLKRKETLSKDLLAFQNELRDITKQIAEQNKQLNESLDFLKAHSAMDKYVVAIRQIDSLKAKQKELIRVSNIEKELKTKIETIKTDISTSNIQAQIYLDSIESLRDTIGKQFVALAKTFYANKKSALTIKVNDGNNQIRFNIEARITSDGSDGIQEIITFCFDWVLLAQNITKQSFIYHDSLLLANVERRQKEILFKIIEKLCGNDKQYIININEDQIDGFNDDTKKIINDNTILVLTDENIASKLLGIEVDLGRETDIEKSNL